MSYVHLPCPKKHKIHGGENKLLKPERPLSYTTSLTLMSSMTKVVILSNITLLILIDRSCKRQMKTSGEEFSQPSGSGKLKHLGPGSGTKSTQRIGHQMPVKTAVMFQSRIFFISILRPPDVFFNSVFIRISFNRCYFLKLSEAHHHSILSNSYWWYNYSDFGKWLHNWKIQQYIHAFRYSASYE